MLSMHGVTKKFLNRIVLDDFNLNVNQHDYVCLVGESGCGKTTVLNILSGMLLPDAGAVYINGTEIFTEMKTRERTLLRNRIVGYLNCGNCLIESLSVTDNLLSPLHLCNRMADSSQAQKLLDKLGIANVSDAFPSQLSAGEYRRVCLARILMLDTDILLLDEPTSNLDSHSAHIIADIVQELKEIKTIVVSTHDTALMCGNVITMSPLK